MGTGWEGRRGKGRGTEWEGEGRAVRGGRREGEGAASAWLTLAVGCDVGDGHPEGRDVEHRERRLLPARAVMCFTMYVSSVDGGGEKICVILGARGTKEMAQPCLIHQHVISLVLAQPCLTHQHVISLVLAQPCLIHQHVISLVPPPPSHLASSERASLVRADRAGRALAEPVRHLDRTCGTKGDDTGVRWWPH